MNKEKKHTVASLAGIGATPMKSRLDLFRKVFLVIFVLASLVAVLLYLGRRQIVIPISPVPSANPHGYVKIDLESLATIGSSILTSLIALFGFWVTTSLSLRKEKRDARESELTLKQKEIELERMRLELEQLKKKHPAKTKNKVNGK